MHHQLNKRNFEMTTTVMHEPKTFSEKLYEEKVLKGIGEENIQALLAIEENDFSPAMTVDELFEALGIADESE